MRTLSISLTVLATGLVATATTAVAEPTHTVCYAGTQVAHAGQMTITNHAVVERTYDPAASEIRQRLWSDKNPTKEVDMTGKVDVKAGTLEFDDPDLGAKGTGKLEGKPWHWTAFQMTLTKGDLVVASTSKVSDTALHQEAHMMNKGKQVADVTGDLAAFDCKQLDAKKAELSKAAAPAPTAPAKPAK